MKPVTYNEAIKLLNGICDGLGTLLKSVEEDSHDKNHEKHLISKWVIWNHDWKDCDEGVGFWMGIHLFLEEFEKGMGQPQNKCLH